MTIAGEMGEGRILEQLLSQVAACELGMKAGVSCLLEGGTTGAGLAACTLQPLNDVTGRWRLLVRCVILGVADCTVHCRLSCRIVWESQIPVLVAPADTFFTGSCMICLLHRAVAVMLGCWRCSGLHQLCSCLGSAVCTCLLS
jgi:hypothetical protein